MTNIDMAQYHKFLNSFVKRLADKIETKYLGEECLISFRSAPPILRGNCLEMNKLCSIIDYLVQHQRVLGVKFKSSKNDGSIQLHRPTIIS